jgi:competence protein ComEC
MDSGGDDRHGSAAQWAAPRLRHQPLVTVAVALAAGVVLDRYGRPESVIFSSGAAPTCFAAWWLAAAVCWTGWWAVWRRPRDVPAAWLLLAAVAISGAAWHDLRWDVFSQHEIARFARDNSQPACVEAIADDVPERLPAPRPTALRAIPARERSRLEVRVTGIRDGTSWLPASGVCQLVVDGSLDGVRAGDRLRVFTQLRRSMPPRNPGEFDFAAHARAERRLAALHSEDPECVMVMSQPGGWHLERMLDAVRAGGKRLLEQYVGPQRSGLAGAMLLGSREGLPTEETASYMVTGTVHLLVVSGLNVAILAMGLYGALRLAWLPRKTALGVIIAVVLAYALIAEGRAPVTRAAVLAVLVCISQWTGRPSAGFNLLAAAVLVVLAINPCDLFRTGPQLSFLAVATLMWNHDHLGRWFRSGGDRLDELIAAARPWYVRGAKRSVRWIVWLCVTTAAVWLASLPLVLYQFHVVTPVAVPMSPAVWIPVLVALWSGFAMLLVGWVVPPLAAVLGWVCSVSLAWLEGVVDWAAALPPPSHFWAPGPAWWWVLGFYLGFVAVMLWGRSLVAPRWQVATLCGWIVIGVVPPLARAAARDQLDVSFVAVGHGTCVVLQAPGGETLLYDAGSLGSPQFVTQTIAGYLWHRGIWHVDAIVLSHADVDHYNAVPGLLERFRVGAVYASPMMFDEFGESADSGALDELRAAIEAAGVPRREIWGGDRLRIGDRVTADVLHPPRVGMLGTDNADSIALAIECDGRRALLPGDLESPGLDGVLTELPLDCDVLMAPHHGSRRSDPPGLAAWCTPEWVVVSGGATADVASVTRTYEAAGARVLHTYDDGTAIFTILDSRPISVWPYGE